MTEEDPPNELVVLFAIVFWFVGISGVVFPWTVYEPYEGDWYIWPCFVGGLLLTAATSAILWSAIRYGARESRRKRAMRKRPMQ